MERELVSIEELLSILNKELDKFPDYGECRYESVTKLDKSDETGCNWGEVILKCSGTHPGTCQPAAFKMVEEMKKKYNLR
ncbi:MAG: hypothetical protein P8Y77_09435 [Nitrospirota bacterium]|jgi:hypothetical protein